MLHALRGDGCTVENTHACVPPLPAPPPHPSVRSRRPAKKIVGNTYTTAEERPSATPSVSTEVWVEIGLRVKDIRARCVFQYDRDESGAAFKRVFLVREGLERLPLDDGETEVRYYVFTIFNLLSCVRSVVLVWHRRSLSFVYVSSFRFKRTAGRCLRGTDFTGSCQPVGVGDTGSLPPPAPTSSPARG